MVDAPVIKKIPLNKIRIQIDETCCDARDVSSLLSTSVVTSDGSVVTSDGSVASAVEVAASVVVVRASTEFGMYADFMFVQ